MMSTAKEKLYLRPLCEDDLDRLLGWHNDEELYTTLAGHFRTVSRETEAAWLRCRMEAADELNLAICLFEPPEHIGNIYLRNVSRHDRNAELHIFIARREHRGHGYGEMAVSLITKHAFEDLGLERIYLHVLANNTLAIRAYEKCGFVKEGRLRRHVFKNGGFEDIIVMGVCREDFGVPKGQ
jgi:RimJ/RimL family protein N-acetyltransferase